MIKVFILSIFLSSGGEVLYYERQVTECPPAQNTYVVAEQLKETWETVSIQCRRSVGTIF